MKIVVDNRSIVRYTPLVTSRKTIPTGQGGNLNRGMGVNSGMMDSKERKQFKENLLELLEHDEETQSRVIQIIGKLLLERIRSQDETGFEY